MTEVVSYVKAYGWTLIEKGYPIVELPKGRKGPLRPGWQNHPLTPDELDAVDPSYGIGILCGIGDKPICALDFDVPDPGLAREVKNRVRHLVMSLNLGLYRVGKPPKFLLVARAAEPGWRKVTTPRYRKGGIEVQLEVLGKGQQFVAYHTHPETGEAYTWPEAFITGTPSMTSVDELPVLTWDEVRRIMEETEKVFREHGYVADGGHRAAADGDMPSPKAPPVEGLTILRCKEIFDTLKPNLGKGSYEDWLSIGMALHHQFGGSGEALQLWKSLSQTYGADAYEEEACDRKWQSFKDERADVSTVTMRTFLKRYNAAMDPLCLKQNEMGLFHRTVRDHDNEICWMPQKARWLCFDKVRKRWDLVMGEVLVSHIIRQDVIERGLAEEIEAASGDYRDSLEAFQSKVLASASSLITRVKSLLKARKATAHRWEEFDAKPQLFLCANGVLDLSDLKTGVRLLEPDPSLRLLRSSDVLYDPDAKCPIWERTVLQIFGDDAEKVRYFQKLVGSALSAERHDEMLMLLRGIGNNGKSLLLEVLRQVFGGYAETLSEDSLLGKNGFGEGGRARSDLAKLTGARFVYCSETSQGNQLREADIKRMTSREPFPARAPFDKEDVNVVPSWRLVLVTNHLPRIKGDDDGIWRRIADLQCPRNFDRDPKIKKDPYLADKCANELSGILNWLIDGLKGYRAEGLKMPEVIAESVKEYRSEMDDVGNWFSTRLIRDPNLPDDFELDSRELYGNFRNFMESCGSKVWQALPDFHRRMKRLVDSGAIESMINGRPSWRRSNNKYRLRGYRFVQPSDEEKIEGFDFI